MMAGSHQRRAVVVLVGGVVPVPVLARLEALYERMAAALRVLARVLARGCVTAPDVPASRAAPEMEPPPVGGQALGAAGAARRHLGVDVRCFGHAPTSPRARRHAGALNSLCSTVVGSLSRARWARYPNAIATVAHSPTCTAQADTRNRHNTTGGNVTLLPPFAGTTPRSSAWGTSLTPGSATKHTAITAMYARPTTMVAFHSPM